LRREISLTRLIPRVNPSRRARGAYRRYVAANYGCRYHPGEPGRGEGRLGSAVCATRNSPLLITNCGRRYSRFLRLVRNEQSIARGPPTFLLSSIYVQPPFPPISSPRKNFPRTRHPFSLSPIHSKFYFLTFYQTLQDVRVEALRQSRTRRMHARIRVDLDQPDRHILGHHEIGAVQLEAATTSFHVILCRQHHQNDGLHHSRVNLIVIWFARMAHGSDNVSTIDESSINLLSCSF